MKKIHVLLVILFPFFSCSTQKNDFSTDEKSFADYQTFIPKLSNELHEISGLMTYNNFFWGFNDSGGKSKLYGFDKSGKIKRKIELEGAKNRDWESITQDSRNIYIGDFGNNFGKRKNLCIYKINKKDIKETDEQRVKTKKISFNYFKQKQFSYANRTTPFDCEAMIEFQGKLYLFSKDWKNRITTAYQIQKEEGNYSLNPTSTFNVNGLITGADISPDKTKLVLLGYENFQSFIWLFSNFKNDDFFSGKKKYLKLNRLENAQTEGVCFWSNNTILISCEKTKAFNQQVFLFNLEQ